jgi:hypothetical protein
MLWSEAKKGYDVHTSIVEYGVAGCRMLADRVGDGTLFRVRDRLVWSYVSSNKR